MKIIVFETEPWERKAFISLSAAHEIHFVDAPLSIHNSAAYADADILSPFIYSDMNVAVLEQFEHLQLIATRSTGFDHIDLNYCREHGILVCNVPTYGENTVAEHVFGLLLNISHRLTQAIDRTRKGDFSLQGLQGFDLSGKTIGVVGTGHIGLCVIKIAKGFGMRIVAYDVNPNEDLARYYDFIYVGMDHLLSEADIITLHVPASEKTYHLIGAEQFDIMKDGSILINTSRGSTVDIKALLRALAEGRIAAAGLDVLPEEPAIREESELLRAVFREEHNLEEILADHVLLRMRNVFITPHSAFYTREAVQRILETTVDNIVAFTRQEPQNLVTG